jgi:hypothetical protein
VAPVVVVGNVATPDVDDSDLLLSISLTTFLTLRLVSRSLLLFRLRIE